MKGLELPISTVVIIVIALVVLLAMIAFLFGVYGPGTESVNLETAKNNACRVYTSMGCVLETKDIPISNFDADQDGVVGDTGAVTSIGSCGPTGVADDNLYMLCKCYYATDDDENLCKVRVCGCINATV